MERFFSGHGEVIIDFDREAKDFQTALLSAIFDVEKSGTELELIGVEH
jgi:hypothetical protein